MNITVSASGFKKVEKLRKKLLAAEEKVSSGKNLGLKRASVLGQSHARRIAPVDTGATIAAINIVNQDSKTFIIRSSTPSNPKKTVKVPYHVFMHLNPTAKNYRGDPTFMFTTAKFLKEVVKKKGKKFGVEVSDIFKV